MRTDGRSSLDFTFWVLETLEENYQAVGSNAIYTPATEGSLMHATIVDCAMVCGVEVPRTFAALSTKVARYNTSTSVEDAMGIRGAILHRQGQLAVSLGDDRRLVGIDSEGSISLYRMSASERDPSHWDGAFLLPEMRYL